MGTRSRSTATTARFNVIVVVEEHTGTVGKDLERPMRRWRPRQSSTCVVGCGTVKTRRKTNL